MKKVKLLTLIVVMALAVTLFAACQAPKTYKVNFTLEGEQINPQTVTENGMAAPPNLSMDGYTVQWYLNGTLYDFTTPVTGDITLTGKKVKTFPETVKVSFVVDGTTVKTETLAGGAMATKPTGYKKDGYTLVWYNKNNVYDFNTVLTGDVTITAKYFKNLVGSGTATDPYLAASIDDIVVINESTLQNKEVFVKLTADVDMGQLSIGTEQSPFKGGFDGNGHSVVLNGKSLFGVVKNAEIKNVKLSGTVTMGTGALACRIENGTVANVYSSASVNGSLTTAFASAFSPAVVAGGIVGELKNSLVYACFVDGNVMAKNIVGGIAGNLANSTVSECAVKSEKIEATENDGVAGGIAGKLDYDSAVYNCYFAASVKADYAGAMVGSADISAPVNYVHGFVSADSQVTGVVFDNKLYKTVSASTDEDLIAELNWNKNNWTIDEQGMLSLVINGQNAVLSVKITLNGAFSENAVAQTVAFGENASADFFKTAKEYVDKGSVFGGLYLDQDLTIPFNTALKLTSDVNIYASYVDARMLDFKWQTANKAEWFDLKTGDTYLGKLTKTGTYKFTMGEKTMAAIYFTDADGNAYRFYPTKMYDDEYSTALAMVYQKFENGAWTEESKKYTPAPDGLLGAWTADLYGSTVTLLITDMTDASGTMYVLKRNNPYTGNQILGYSTYVRPSDDAQEYWVCGYSTDQDEFFWGFVTDWYGDKKEGFIFFETVYEADAKQFEGTWLAADGKLVTFDVENAKIKIGDAEYAYTVSKNEQKGSYLTYEAGDATHELQLTFYSIKNTLGQTAEYYGRYNLNEFNGVWGSPDGADVIEITDEGVKFNGETVNVNYAFTNGNVVGSFAANNQTYNYYLYDTKLLKVSVGDVQEYYIEKAVKDLYVKNYKNLEMTLNIKANGNKYTVEYNGAEAVPATIRFFDDPEVNSVVLSFKHNDNIMFLLSLDGGNNFFYLVDSLNPNKLSVCMDATLFDELMAEYYLEGVELTDIFGKKIHFVPEENKIVYTDGTAYLLKTNDYSFDSAGKINGVSFFFGENDRFLVNFGTHTTYIYDQTIQDQNEGTESYIKSTDFESIKDTYKYWGGKQDEIIVIEEGKVTVTSTGEDGNPVDVEYTKGIHLWYQYLNEKYVPCVTFPFSSLNVFIIVRPEKASLITYEYFRSGLYAYRQTVYASADGNVFELTRQVKLLLNNAEVSSDIAYSVTEEGTVLEFTFNEKAYKAVFMTAEGLRKVEVTVDGVKTVYTEVKFDYNKYVGAYESGNAKIYITALYDLFGGKPFIALQSKSGVSGIATNLSYKVDAAGNLVLFNSMHEITLTEDGIKNKGVNFYRINEETSESVITPFVGIYKTTDNKAIVLRPNAFLIDNVQLTTFNLTKRADGGFDVALTYGEDEYTGTLTLAGDKPTLVLISGEKRIDAVKTDIKESDFVGNWKCGATTVAIAKNVDMMTGEDKGLKIGLFDALYYSFDADGNFVLSTKPFFGTPVSYVYKDGKLELVTVDYYEKEAA